MGGIFGFLKSFGKGKLSQAGQSITQRIVSWDPETASQAEIEEMIAELDKITIEAGKAKSSYDKEKAEADAARKNYDRYIAAAELLNKQLDESNASGNPGKAQELGTSLEKLLGELEKLRPEVEREVREAEEAQAYYDEIKELAEMTAQKVRTAREQLDSATREMRRAEAERDKAQARAERAEHVAGLRKDTSSLGVALEAMNRQAEEAKSKAGALDMKARLLTPVKAKEDENIKAALSQVSGEAAPASASLAERLEALRKK